MKIILLAAMLLPVAFCAQAKTAAELEKEKALANPYPNDLGPARIDEAVKSYPADRKEGYRLLLTRCAQCHTPARPLNSRFVEPAAGLGLPPAEREKKQQAAIAAMKKEHPERFADAAVWQIEAGLWSRYVKRMMNKPGCGAAAGGKMTDAEAKKIYEFLVFDGEKRKLGANAQNWKAHRESLVSQLKTKNPKRYAELAKDNDL